jgi:hypothetical protein
LEPPGGRGLAQARGGQVTARARRADDRTRHKRVRATRHPCRERFAARSNHLGRPANCARDRAGFDLRLRSVSFPILNEGPWWAVAPWGVGAFVFRLGGGIEALRLHAAHVPVDQAPAVVPKDTLIASMPNRDPDPLPTRRVTLMPPVQLVRSAANPTVAMSV